MAEIDYKDWGWKEQIASIRDKHGRPDAGMMGVWCDSVKANTQRGNRDITVIATTADIDLDDEVVNPAGINWAYFQRNKSVFMDHRYVREYTVGHMRHIWAVKSSAGEIVGWKIEYRVDNNALGDDLLRTIIGGHLPGASIGFTPADRGPPTEAEAKRYTKGGKTPSSIVRASNGLEVSATFMPCNVACQADTPSFLDESKLASLDNLVTKGLIRRESALVFGLRDARRRAIVLV